MVWHRPFTKPDKINSYLRPTSWLRYRRKWNNRIWFLCSWFCSASLSDSQEAITQKDTRAISSPTACHAGILARFLSLSGHVALRHMVHLDVGVLGEIKRRQVIEENDKEKEKQAKKTRGAGSESTVNSAKVAKTHWIENRNDCCQQLWRDINLRWTSALLPSN